ncbi:DUF4974 domain-containing protein [Arundinibacter roseus]|uniref:DUF4974 domain-containing protein n=2 Tax=Arundinibacter roseus TaxID=2070510 RepID=A0A4R4KMQ5_9BACT|nr:DUF4974 domain-containing protein [Arundinibacter roseus]
MANQATRSEIEQVQAWLEQSPDRVQELKGYRKLWEHSQAVGQPRRQVDTEAAWKKMQANMHAKSVRSAPEIPKIEENFAASPQELPEKSRRLNPIFWAAATLTLLMAAWGWLYFSKEQPTTPVVAVSTQQNTYEKTLPDGTVVHLNYNSTLSFENNLEGDTRRVSLRGEAFFNVAPDPAHPFVIDANGTEVTVLGTSFNVKAYGDAVRVDVRSGKVAVRKNEHRVELSPGEGVDIQADTVFRTIQANLNLAAYGTQVFEFTAQNLDSVVQTLNQGFHADIRLANPQLARCRLTARYERETLDYTLSMVAETLQLSIRREGNIYWLEGSGCL